MRKTLAGRRYNLVRASGVAGTLAYPYWHQRGFVERNPPPVG